MISAEAYLSLQQDFRILQSEKEELMHDNRLLVRQINELRSIIEHFYHKDLKQKKLNQMHEEQLLFQDKKATAIIDQVLRSEKNQIQFFEDKFKGIMKEAFYKKMEKVQKQFEIKKKECDGLLDFKEKINRLFLSWESKNKNPNEEELYKWVYNQITKAKTIAKPKSIGKKKTNDKNTTFSSSKEHGNPFSQI